VRCWRAWRRRAWPARPRRPAPQVDFPKRPGTFGGGAPGTNNRAEIDLYDCEVEGTLPDIDGVFYRVGPDPQYPKARSTPATSPSTAKATCRCSASRTGTSTTARATRGPSGGRRSTKRGRSLFGMYRNPLTDDPSVKGLSRGTANTQLFLHHGKLLVFKEDSPPVYMDPLTLETLDDYYTFGGKLASQTHTAHPKIDPLTGEYIGFGYEASGLLSKDIFVFSADRQAT
jgi:carotenoid cleavage dioxygenase